MNTAPASPAARYSRVAVALHWVLGLAIIGAFVMGVYMSDLPNSPAKLKLINYHKWAGITILTLSALRLLWRLTHRPPADVPMPAWQARAAHVTHFALYALFFAVPLVGWAYSSAAGFPVVVYGVLPLPDFVSPDKELAKVLKGTHGNLAFLMAIFVIGHIAGALKHQLIDHDGLIARMSFRKA
jgi:cytochrome b561